jgi:hypothetical protein
MARLPGLGSWHFLAVFLRRDSVVPPDLRCSESAFNATDSGLLATVSPQSLLVFRLA